MLLSILIPTIPNRRNTPCQQLLDYIEAEVEDKKDVEILCLYDNKRRSIGEKRNALVSLARGEYITFIDDDDVLMTDYVEEVLKALESKPDCVTFNVKCTGYEADLLCTYNKDAEHKVDFTKGTAQGPPAHIHVFKAKFFKENKFPSLQSGEDMDWSKRVCKQLGTVVNIDKVLYHYDFNASTSESR